MVTAAALLAAAVVLLPARVPSSESSSPVPAASTAAEASPGSPAATNAGPTIDVSIGHAGFHIGEPAPALVVAQLGGGQVNLANLAGRPVWINFMQTTCPPCVDEFPLMNGFAARYENSGLVVIAIDVREDEGAIAAFAQMTNAQFPIGLDPAGTTAETWSAVALPVHFWVDRDGIIRAGALGGIGPDIMAENLGRILPGVNVTP